MQKTLKNFISVFSVKEKNSTKKFNKMRETPNLFSTFSSQLLHSNNIALKIL